MLLPNGGNKTDPHPVSDLRLDPAVCGAHRGSMDASSKELMVQEGEGEGAEILIKEPDERDWDL